MKNSILRPSTSPPPIPTVRPRVGIHVDVDGKRSRLPGDTVRQVITPGRIRNLASMFDKKAQQSNINDRSKSHVTTVLPKTTECIPEVGEDINNNKKIEPPRKPLRSFANDIAIDNMYAQEIQLEENEIENLLKDRDIDIKHEDTILGGDEYAQRSNLFMSCLEEINTPVVTKALSRRDATSTPLPTRNRSVSQGAEQEIGEISVIQPLIERNHDEEITARRSRTVSRTDEQSVNGQIDNLFEFVDEHLSSKQSRSSRECLYQPRFSPSAAPNIAELSQDFDVYAKSNTSKTSKRVGSALATSTPQNSRRSSSANHNATHIEEDVSFVSTIQNTSQSEAIIQYETLITKNERQLDRTNQQISMLQKALAQARKERKPMQEVNAQKSLLVARERVVLLQREIKRLKALVACRRPLPNQCLEVRGSLTISNVAVHLNRNFYTKPYEIATNYSFLVILKCGFEVECTATHNLLAHQSSRLKVVHFDEKINFCNLPVDFCVMLEVYAMAIPEREPETTCASIIASKCRNFLPRERVPSSSPSGFPYGEFVRCGYLQLTRDTTGTNKFYMDDVEYPLEGTIDITTHCTTLPPAISIDHRGFLTMYQCISGMSSWERYWAVLRRGVVFFWKYPEDEGMEKLPKARLDLSTCPQYEVHPCSQEQCPRQHTFTVNVLVNTAPSVMDKKRIFLAADSKAQMKDWLEAINETLAVIRGNLPYKGSVLRHK